MNREYFAEFVASALPRLLRFGHMLTGNRDEAEDLVQTALARTWRAGRVRNIDDLYSFVRKVMVNSYASWYRRRRTKEIATDRLPDAEVVYDETNRIDDRDRVCRALLELPPRQRAVMVLRYYEDLSEVEVATAMGTSVGTVKSQAARALRRLEAVLTVPGADEATHRRSRS